MALHIVFSHGKESGPWGCKIKAMATLAKPFGEIHSIDYQSLVSPDDRANKLINYINTLNGNIILVGSSMGGYVSTLAANNEKVVGLFLLAPAFYLPGYNVEKPTTTCNNIAIVHGWQDDIVSFTHSVDFAHNHQSTLKLVADGHRLSNSYDVLAAELAVVIHKGMKSITI
jgi:predicted alpha/beta hydrolase family esterase